MTDEYRSARSEDVRQPYAGSSGAVQIGRKAADIRKRHAAGKRGITGAAGRAPAGRAAKRGAGTIVSLLPLLIPALTMVLFLYALPSVIYEGVQSYASEVRAVWQETAAAGSSRAAGELNAFFTTGGKLVGDLFSAIAGAVSDGKDENDSFTEYDAMVTWNEEAERNVLIEKRRACTNKVNQRIEVIADDLRNSGEIDAWFRDRFRREYGAGYVYDPAEVIVRTVPLSEPYANEILAFYTVQTGGNVTGIDVSELLSWLGQKTDGETVPVRVGGRVDAEVTAWHGRFLPQYLLEQKRAEELLFGGETKTDFARMQCAAADLLIAVESPDFASLEPALTPVRTAVTGPDGEGRNRTETHVRWTVTITAGCRDPGVLSGMAGLWDGALYEEQDPGRLEDMADGIGHFPLYAVSRDTGLVTYPAAEGYDASGYVEKGLLTWPVPGAPVSSKFGPRICPFHGEELHTGVDLKAAAGTPVLSPGDGTVVEAAYAKSLGNHVTIHHGNGIYTSCYHLSDMAVHAGQRVSRGQRIGSVGSTGDATGPHLHFVLMIGGINYSNRPSNTSVKDPLSVIAPE